MLTSLLSRFPNHWQWRSEFKMTVLFQCKESGHTVTVDVHRSERSPRDLEAVAAKELYGTSQPLKLRYIPTMKTGTLRGIFHQNALFQAIKLFVLTVKGCTDIEVSVHIDTTIGEVKSMMQKLDKGLLEGEQLVLLGSVLEDEQMLCQYGVGPLNSVIVQRYCIFIETESTIHTHYVAYDETVYDLKKVLVAIEGTALKNQVLFFKDTELKHSKSLYGYDIEHYSTVYMDVERDITVTLSTAEVKHIVIRAKSSVTAKEIKEYIFAKEGIEPNEQVLMFNDEKLDDHTFLSTYYIHGPRALDKGVISHVVPTKWHFQCYLKCVGQIFVKSWHGDTVTLDVDRFNSVKDVEDQLVLCPLCPKNMTLLYGGKPLRIHSKTLNHYNIQMGSTLDMMEGFMLIYYKYCSTMARLEVKTSYTVREVKEEMYSCDQLCPDKHRLIYAGKILEDHRSLAYYNILTTTELHVIKGMVMFIHEPSGEIITLSFSASDEIADVKAQIEKEKGYPVDNQKLWYTCQWLENDRELHEYNVPDGCNFDLVLLNGGGMAIFAYTLAIKPFPLCVQPLDTIAHIKELIYDKMYVFPRMQRLVYDDQLLEDDQTLSDYGIQRKSYILLRMVGRMQVFVKEEMNGSKCYSKNFPIDTFGLIVDASDKVELLKRKIANIQGFHSRVLCHKMRISYHGRQLEDGLALCDYMILNNSTCFLEVDFRKEVIIHGGTIEVKVKLEMLTGKVFTVTLGYISTVKCLKLKIQEKEGVPPDRQALFCCGERLEDCKPISHYTKGRYNLHLVLTVNQDIYVRIPPEECEPSTLSATDFHVVQRFTGNPLYEPPTKRMIKCQVPTGGTIENVKYAIHSVVGIPPT